MSQLSDCDCAEQKENKQWFICELFIATSLVLYSIVRSWILWILPKRYKDITDDIVLITGGGRGVGRCIAVQLAKHKPKHIVLWGRDEDGLRATCRAIQLLGVACTYMQCDVSSRDNIYRSALAVKGQIGVVTLLVNNAGVVYGQNVIDASEEHIEKTFQVNILSHFWTVKAFLPAMLDMNHGHIVTISSMLGLMGLAGATDYTASKFATTGMAEALRHEILAQRKENVHVTSVHPYLIDTDMFAGLSTRVDWLFPPLDKEYVAWKTIDGILTNQQQLLMPRSMYFMVWLKTMLPITALHIVNVFTGVDKAMENFHGRKKKI